MKYLKAYEAFEIGDFKSFINKYKKSGGYISKNDIKRLDASDVKYEYFKNIETSINNCIRFFNNNDFDLLEDILLDVYDECPFLDRTGTFKYFALKCTNKNYWNNNSIEFIVSEDDKGLASRDHVKLSSKDVILDTLVNKSIENIQKQIEKQKDSLKTDQSGRPGKDPISLMTIRELVKTNPFRKVEISPIIEIDFKSRNTWEDDEDWDDDGGWNSPRKQAERERSDKIIKFSTEALNRYFSAIGYDGIKFQMSAKSIYSTWYNPNYQVVVSL